MSFNLNKLVQPECGAPNPLVKAAQQIATKSAPVFRNPGYRFHGTTMANLRAPTQVNQINFAKEFAQREPPPLQLAGTSKQQQLQQPMTASNHRMHTSCVPTSQPQHSMMSYHSIGQQWPHVPAEYMQHYQTFLSQHQAGQIGQASVEAGDQLETKYRNDLNSQTSRSNQTLGEPEGRLDDVQFWQSISQAYIGPATFDNIAKMRANRRTTDGTQTSLAAATAPQETLAATDKQDSDKPTTTAEQQDQLDDGDLTAGQEEKLRLWEEGLEAARLMEEVKIDDLDYAFDERNPLKEQFEDPFSEGLKRLEQGDIPSAALLFEAAVQREPDNSIAWRYLGTTQAQNEKDKSAIRALTRCLQLDPSDQLARLAISVSLVNETQHHEACEHLLEWLIGHDTYKSSISASLDEFRRLDEAQSAADPFGMNYSQEASKRYEYVRDKFVQAARLSPNSPDPDVQSSLGVLFNMRGEYDKAVDCFKAALSVRSDDSFLWNRLGATLANSNKSDEAVVAYRRALEIAPGFLRSRYNLAISLIHLNLYEEAGKQLVQILNTQAAGRGSKNAQLIRTRSITSTSIWNTLRTVSTLMNKPELYPIIDGRDLAKCNELLLGAANSGSSS